MRKHFLRRLLVLLLPVAALLIFFSVTNPRNLSVPLFLIPIVLLFICIYIWGKAIIGKLSFKPGQSLTKKVLAFVMACILTSAIVLQSIDQLTTWDFLLFCLLIVLIAGYIKKIGPSL